MAKKKRKTKKINKSQNITTALIISALTVLAILYYNLLIWFFFKTRFPYEGWDFLVPIIAIVISWLSFRKLQKQKPLLSSDKRGFGLIIIAILFYIASFSQSGFELLTLSFILMISGLLFIFGGRVLWSYFSFPLSFLLFKLPWGFYMLNYFGTDSLSIIQAKAIALMSGWFGIPSKVTGFVVAGPKFISTITPKCSGWYTVDAKMLVGILFIYFSKDTLQTKIIKGILLFPIISIINLFRILSLHLGWNIFYPQINPDLIHTISNHIHKIVLLFTYYLLAFGQELRKKR